MEVVLGDNSAMLFGYRNVSYAETTNSEEGVFRRILQLNHDAVVVPTIARLKPISTYSIDLELL